MVACAARTLVAIVLFAILGSMLHSDVDADAMARARAYPNLVATLGIPITPDLMPMGSASPSTGTAVRGGRTW